MNEEDFLRLYEKICQIENMIKELKIQTEQKHGRPETPTEYFAVEWEEYKELLIIKGKYEELKRQKELTIQYIPNIQPLSTPYPQDLPLKYPNTIFCDKKDEVKLQNNIVGVK